MKPPSIFARTSRGRRDALAALGAAGAILVAGRSLAQVPPAAACVLTPQQTEGPFFVDERLERSDIRSDPADETLRPGALLTLQLRVSSVDGARCAPLAGAIVDVWHCDAAGVYSDAENMSAAGPPQGANRAPSGGSASVGGTPSVRTKGSRFLRGYQSTDANGRVRFTTIYPGAYPGRAVHIHFKVRTQRAPASEFTSQLYFDDALTDRVHAQKPYAGPGERRTRNDRDGLYRRGGQALTLDVVPTGEGFAATYNVGLRLRDA